MADNSNLTALLVGGALALAGTVVSQAFGLLSGWVDRRHQRDIRRRERLEEMADAVSASLQWFQTLSGCHTIEEVRTHQPPPEARRAATIALLYFPRLFEPAAAYVNSLIRYYHLALDCYQPGHPASLGAQMVMMLAKAPPEVRQRHDEPTVYRQRLDDAIAAEAKRYFHA